MASPTSLVRFAMKGFGRRKQCKPSNAASRRTHGGLWTTSLVAFALGPLGAGLVRAADATSPVDYTQRNAPFAPAADARVVPDQQKPVTNGVIQEKRVDKNLVEKTTAPHADRRAGIDVTETRDKHVREKESQRPAAQEQPTSAFNHRRASIATSSDTTKPPTVAKYQDSLTAASASNMARFPAVGRATTTKINRFVFRKNPADASTPVEGKPVTPAGGRAAEGALANQVSVPK
jgi:hypothetical protein